MVFEELHGKGGSGMNVGVDLTTLMTSQVSISTAGESGGGGSGSGDMTVPRIASFQVYWDVQGKQFKVFSPKVVDPSGSEIKVTETVLSRGTYVCEVKKGKTTNVYTAEIKLIDSIVPSDETVTVVKIFKIEDGKVEQYHVGAIILGDKGGSSSNPAAFDLEVSESSTGTKTGKIVRCNFVFDGENKSLPDFSVSGSGSVYLVAKQPAPSGGTSEPSWKFGLSETKEEATGGGRVVNYKLYDLNDFAVTCDYRTTFMELKSPHKVSYFRVGLGTETEDGIICDALNSRYKTLKVAQNSVSYVTAAAQESSTYLRAQRDDFHLAELRASSETAKLRLISDGKTVTISGQDLKVGQAAGFHKLKVTHADGTYTEYDVLADKDLEINDFGELPDKDVISDLSFDYESGILYVTKTKYNLKTGKETVGSPETVFTTEPHSEQS